MWPMPTRPTDGSVNTAPILVTMGEPAGVGPEVAMAACALLGGAVDGHPLMLVGDTDILAGASVPVLPTTARARPTPSRPDPVNAPAVIEAITLATDACLTGTACAMVTAPIHKAVLMQAGFAYPGHTEFLAARTATRRAVMMLAGPDLRVVPLTIHMPIAQVPAAITKQAVFDTGEIILTALAREFGIANPRLAVAGLNPHAGEDGELGDTEERVIHPAVAALRARGFSVAGPLPADTMFHPEARARYDAALCMYHDQALIPIKTLNFWDGVNVTLGLPIIRTSPDHGTALDIAGANKADPRSMVAAIRMAAAMADTRARA